MDPDCKGDGEELRGVEGGEDYNQDILHEETIYFQ